MSNEIRTTVTDATATQKGSTTLSTDALTIAGIDNQTSVTPQNLKSKLGTQELGKIAIGQGDDETIHWGNVVSPDSSITATYNPTTKNLELTATGDITNVCLENPTFSEGKLAAEPVCIPPDANGSFKFTSDSSITLTPIPNGLHITATGGGGGSDWNIIKIRDETSETRIAQDKTIYIINNINPVKATLQLPATARLGFWFRVIGINGGCNINTNVSGGQFLKWKDNNSESTLVSDDGWQDFYIFCYEENVRFKWLTF